jgi:hypothetical protein
MQLSQEIQHVRLAGLRRTINPCLKSSEKNGNTMLQTIKYSFKRMLRRLAFKIFERLGGEKRLVLLGQIHADQIRARGQLRELSEAEFSAFSQWGEDGIISWLVDLIDPSNKTFVEFGVEDFKEANCRYLMATRNWSGLVIDGGSNNIKAIRGDTVSYKYDLQSIEAFITRENINELIDRAGFGDDLGLLSRLLGPRKDR